MEAKSAMKKSSAVGGKIGDKKGGRVAVMQPGKGPGNVILANFHYPKTLVKGSDDRWQLPVESLQQCALAAISNSHPKQFASVALPVARCRKSSSCLQQSNRPLRPNSKSP